ncbi:MAG: DUF4349 domain-containing protein [Pseudomonadota bacterium]
MTRIVWITAAALVLAACGGSGGGDTSALLETKDMVASEAAPGRFRAAPAPAPSALQAPPLEPAPSDDPVTDDTGEQFIAYSHSIGLRLPLEAVEPAMQGHVTACRAVGPSVCIVTNSNLSKQSDDYSSGYLSLRAKPEWIESFLDTIDAAAEEAGGEVSQRSSRAEDLTRVILDTDARLNAQTVLKARLETLLETRDGELSDFLAIERELARVTGEIESITSQLKAMRLRVSMSELSLNYETKRSLVSGGRRNPLLRAFGDFFYNLSEALASVITFFALALPWLFVIGFLLFIWLRAIWPWVRKRRNKPAS